MLELVLGLRMRCEWEVRIRGATLLEAELYVNVQQDVRDGANGSYTYLLLMTLLKSATSLVLRFTWHRTRQYSSLSIEIYKGTKETRVDVKQFATVRSLCMRLLSFYARDGSRCIIAKHSCHTNLVRAVLDTISAEKLAKVLTVRLHS